MTIVWCAVVAWFSIIITHGLTRASLEPNPNEVSFRCKPVEHEIIKLQRQSLFSRFEVRYRTPESWKKFRQNVIVRDHILKMLNEAIPYIKISEEKYFSGDVMVTSELQIVGGQK